MYAVALGQPAAFAYLLGLDKTTYMPATASTGEDGATHEATTMSPPPLCIAVLAGNVPLLKALFVASPHHDHLNGAKNGPGGGEGATTASAAAAAGAPTPTAAPATASASAAAAAPSATPIAPPTASAISVAPPQVNARWGRVGLTPLMCAALTGLHGVVHGLVSAGARVDARDALARTALLLAAQAGHETCVHELIACGASVDAQSARGVTPLMAAAAAGKEATILELLWAGSDIDLRDTVRTTRHAAGPQPAPSSPRSCPSSTHPPPPPPQLGNTALMYAIRSGCTQAVRDLLSSGCVLSDRNADGDTAASLAKRSRHTAMADFEVVLEGSSLTAPVR